MRTCLRHGVLHRKRDVEQDDLIQTYKIVNSLEVIFWATIFLRFTHKSSNKPLEAAEKESFSLKGL